MEHPGRYSLCRRCGLLMQHEPTPGFPTPQRCGCDRGSSGEPKWDRYDFNEQRDLCRCCRMVTVPSGSKWAVWFCDDCKSMVRVANHEFGRAVLPIGRHSLMNGVGLQGVKLKGKDQRQIAELARGLHHDVLGLFGAITRLDDVMVQRTRQLWVALRIPDGGRWPLDDWLDRLRSAARSDPSNFGKRAAFEALLRSVTEPS